MPRSPRSHYWNLASWSLLGWILAVSRNGTSDKPHVCVQGVAQVALSLSFASKSIPPFDPRDHGDESQDAQMCKLQEVWATSKGPPCEILHALFCGQRKAERQRFIWELKRQSRERGELKRKWQSKKRGEREEG